MIMMTARPNTGDTVVMTNGKVIDIVKPPCHFPVKKHDNFTMEIVAIVTVKSCVPVHRLHVSSR